MNQDGRWVAAGALLSALALAGCVTTSDLDELGQRLTERLDAVEANSQRQVEALRGDLKDVRSAQEAQRGDLGQVRRQMETVISTVEESQTLRARSHEELRAGVARNHRMLAEHRQTLDDYAGRSAEALERIAELTRRATRQVESVAQQVTGALLGSFRAEEAALRERLQAIAEARRHLEAATGSALVDDPEPSQPGSSAGDATVGQARGQARP